MVRLGVGVVRPGCGRGQAWVWAWSESFLFQPAFFSAINTQTAGTGGNPGTGP